MDDVRAGPAAKAGPTANTGPSRHFGGGGSADPFDPPGCAPAPGPPFGCVLCCSTKLAVNFTKLFFLKRGTPIVMYIEIDYQNFHETGLFPLTLASMGSG